MLGHSGCLEQHGDTGFHPLPVSQLHCLPGSWLSFSLGPTVPLSAVHCAALVLVQSPLPHPATAISSVVTKERCGAGVACRNAWPGVKLQQGLNRTAELSNACCNVREQLKPGCWLSFVVSLVFGNRGLIRTATLCSAGTPEACAAWQGGFLMQRAKISEGRGCQDWRCAGRGAGGCLAGGKRFGPY